MSKSYTAVLNELREEMSAIRAEVAASDNGVITLRLDTLEGNQREMLVLLRQMNSTVKENETGIAVEHEWRGGHEKVHEALEGEVKYISRKANMFAVAEALFAAGGSLLSFILSK